MRSIDPELTRDVQPKTKGHWAFPGGHLEHGESFTDCAERETLEETALRVRGVKVLDVTNDVFTELGKHYITIFVLCQMLDQQQQPQVSRVEVWPHPRASGHR